jgi:hypothetical protein
LSFGILFFFICWFFFSYVVYMLLGFMQENTTPFSFGSLGFKM